MKIDGNNDSFAIDPAELWRYRDLALLLAKRDFTLRYKQTVLGPVWLLVSPLVTCIIYAFVFSGVAGISTEGIPALLFYLVGTGIWSFVSSIVLKTASNFTSNSNIFGKVYFPRLIMPASYVLVAFVELVIRLALTVAFAAYYIFADGLRIDLSQLYLLPLTVIWAAILALGVGLIVSSLTTKYRDLTILVSFGVHLWMYVTPIVYPLSQMSSTRWYFLIELNPATAPVEMFRMAILGVGGVSPRCIVSSAVISLVLFTLGLLLFRRVEKNFMDTV